MKSLTLAVVIAGVLTYGSVTSAPAAAAVPWCGPEDQGITDALASVPWNAEPDDMEDVHKVRARRAK